MAEFCGFTTDTRTSLSKPAGGNGKTSFKIAEKPRDLITLKPAVFGRKYLSAKVRTFIDFLASWAGPM